MEETRLQTLSAIPDGFLDCDATELFNVLDGPTLINLPGMKTEPLFICTLLHGNETTGFRSIQRVLKQLDLGSLPRALSILIGNVEAARVGARRLPHQPDYNRIWAKGDRREHGLAREVLKKMAGTGVFACIDIHNNTGRNPHYAIVAARDEVHLSLAGKFGDKVVYATYPDSSCSVAFSSICPAITIEAGMVSDASGVDHVAGFLHECIRDDSWRTNGPGSFDLFHTVAVVKLQDSCSVGLMGEETDVQLEPDVDRLNFNMLDPGTSLGLARNGNCLLVEGTGRAGKLSDYLSVEHGQLRTVRPLMPAMLTTDFEVIKMDCLCYLMERLR